MHPLYRAIAVAAITFGASVVGMALQWVVPAELLTASRGSVGAMVGLVTLLLALVLGLLVFTAFAVFTTQRDEAFSLGPMVAEIDLALELYGPEAADGRTGLLVFTAFAVFTTQRDEAFSLGPMVAEIDLALELYGPEAAGGRTGLLTVLRRSRARFFGDSECGPQPFSFEEMRAIFLSQASFFDSLKPATEQQKGLLATARDQVRKFADTQMLMARQLAHPFPPHVLTVVVCWASALFLGNGLVAATNPVSVLAHLAGAISIGIAIFLILELSHPYTGLIRLSPEALDRVLEILAEAETKKAAAQ